VAGAGRGPSTRSVHAGLPAEAQGEPFLPGPVFAAPFHLRGPVDAAPYTYGRYDNPAWSNLEAALGELEGGDVVVFSSGMAAVSAIVVEALRPGDVLVAPADAYPGIRSIATEHLSPRGIEARLVPSEAAAVREAMPGATLVWIESPSNPGLDVLDVAALTAEAHAGGAAVAVDNTLAGPLRTRPLDAGADWAVMSASKHITGHSDLVLGYVATRDAERAAALRAWRGTTGAIPGPFEAWLAHRSLATYAVRLERQERNAGAVAELLRARDDVADVRWRSSRRRRASAGCTPAASAARAGAPTTWPKGGSASARGSRTPRTSSRTSRLRWTACEGRRLRRRPRERRCARGCPAGGRGRRCRRAVVARGHGRLGP
jgi:cystathionine gamma-lyase